jgi:hypothetical protein
MRVLQVNEKLEPAILAGLIAGLPTATIRFHPEDRSVVLTVAAPEGEWKAMQDAIDAELARRAAWPK